MVILVNLVLIECEKEAKRERTFRRLDTKEIVPKEYVDVLNEPPLILQFKNHEKLNSTINLPISHYPIHANALLLGDRIQEQEDDYYAVSFCRIKKE